MAKNILLIGLGGFGKNHLRAWHEMGMGGNLFVAELNRELHRDCAVWGMPAERITTDFKSVLDKVDIVDVVTPSTSHFELCKTAIEAGKDVFVEKPMTMTSRDADLLAGMVRDNKRVLQVGYYYRYHPMSVYTKTQIQESSLGNLRYLSGSFMGFKRTRTDVGVTHTDGIHFIDLFNWLVGEPPLEVYAIVRDHFGRGMEDASIVLIQYRNGVVGKVESGYIQPGKWHDKVVANAKTTKEIFVCGSSSTIEADYETDTLVVHDVRHEFNGITWAPVGKGSRLPSVGTGTPHQMICSELQSFLDRIGGKRRPHPDVIGSGVVLARVMEAIYESARRNTPVKLDWTPEQLSSLIEGGVQ